MGASVPMNGQRYPHDALQTTRSRLALSHMNARELAKMLEHTILGTLPLAEFQHAKMEWPLLSDLKDSDRTNATKA
jgi:hypothetical protein